MRARVLEHRFLQVFNEHKYHHSKIKSFTDVCVRKTGNLSASKGISLQARVSAYRVVFAALQWTEHVCVLKCHIDIIITSDHISIMDYTKCNLRWLRNEKGCPIGIVGICKLQSNFRMLSDLAPLLGPILRYV